MTKEELEHEHIREIAENYVNESWGSYLDLDEVDLVMAGIGVGKIIASEQEKRIEELENQIADIKANCDLAIEGRDIKIKELEQQIVQLKKDVIENESDCANCGLRQENEELKERYNKVDIIGYDALKNLTKAKEILAKLLEEEKNNMYWEMNGSNKSSYYEVRKQAEQFLQEIEK